MSNDTIVPGSGIETITISSGALDDYVCANTMADTVITIPGMDTITLTGIDSFNSGAIGGTIAAGPGITGNGINWNSGSTVTFTDPYEELTSRLEKLEAMIAEEKEIRDNCPAVRNAYDEYRFLLVLAKKNKGDLLTEE